MPDFAIWDGRSAMLQSFLRQVLVTLLTVTPALAASPAEQRGKAYAHSHCARCHAIDRVSRSPLEIAPPFRTLHLRYPIETLGEALAEGIYTGHAEMPESRTQPGPDSRSAVLPEDPRISLRQRLQRLHGPGNHLLRDPAERVVEGRRQPPEARPCRISGLARTDVTRRSFRPCRQFLPTNQSAPPVASPPQPGNA